MELESAHLIIKFLQEGAYTNCWLKRDETSANTKSCDLKALDVSNNKWITVQITELDIHRNSMSSLTLNINPVLTTSIIFASLSNLNDPLTTTNGDRNTQTTSEKCPVPYKKKHKLVILGDNHVKGLSEKISSSFDSSYSVMGVSKPNAWCKRHYRFPFQDAQFFEKGCDYSLWRK
jgi:hypothetical protein